MKRLPLTIRETAALLAALLLAACGGGGGGTFSPFAPGVSGGSPATPAPTLAVAPASNTFSAVGSTATVVATISSGQAGVQVAYTGGCDGVASITPKTQTTLAGGSTPPYTLTALQANAACRAQFQAEGATATTVATVGTATPPPSPTPSPIPTLATTPSPAPTATPAPPAAPSPTPMPTLAPTPTPGPLVVTPTSILIGNAYPATSTSATINASRTNYVGAFTEADNCTAPGLASITSATASSWTVAWTPLANNIATASAFCQVTISAAGGASATVQVGISATGVVIQ